jgi:endonuclease YncB( thermonuclease family)
LAFVTAVAIAVQISRERRVVEIPVLATPPARQQEMQAAPPAREQEMPSGLMGRASVIDGDTIDIHGTRIRLNGIDAPESRQTCEANGTTYRCGQRAAIALSDFLTTHVVSCEQTGTDRYRRVLATCSVDGADIGEWMVSQGWAIAYRKYSVAYVQVEEKAHAEKRGLWAGTFLNPEQWRRTQGDSNVRQ